MKKKYPMLYSILLLGYLLGLRNGYLALWEADSGVLLDTFPIRAQLLPPADQHRLEQGIRIGSWEELMVVMEDYLS